MRTGLPSSAAENGPAIGMPLAASIAAVIWSASRPMSLAQPAAAPVNPQFPCGCRPGTAVDARP
ncbi:hypothetical protein ACFOJ6_02500 [Gordonia humi]|uniref:hypothetical protein n=1 Tax=Gordonia humi TaxID=686429 RepID=UPI0036144F0E